MKTNEDKIVRVAKALSDKTRLKMLKEIAEKGSLNCTEAEQCVELSQPTVSHHIKILTDAGLLNVTKEGRFNFISINQETLDEFKALIGEAVK